MSCERTHPCGGRLAILGAGHLATALIEGFTFAEGSSILIHNRTPGRAAQLARRFPNVTAVDDEAAFDSESCPLLVVIPGRALLQLPEPRARRLRDSGRTVVSCVNGLPLPVLEARFPGVPFAKAIPSVGASVRAGVTLVARGAVLDERRFEAVREIFGRVGRVIEVEREDEMERLSVVTSCFPGILAAILDEFAAAYGLTEVQARELLLESSFAALLLGKERMRGFGDIAAGVSNAGGLTEIGVATMRRSLPPIFAELRLEMERKQEQRRRLLCQIAQE